MTLPVLPIFQSTLFWAKLTFLFCIWIGASRLCGSALKWKNLLFLFTQAAILVACFRLPSKVIGMWAVLGFVSYLVATRAPEKIKIAAIWVLWLGTLVFFRESALLIKVWPSLLNRTPNLPYLFIGHSYIALRSLSFAVDLRAGRIKNPAFLNYLSFLMFALAFVAGPIDRYTRFENDLNTTTHLDAHRLLTALTRIIIGAFKKFVVAGFFSHWILPPNVAWQTTSANDIWIGFYAYAFYIYTDFSAYSDLAIGVGHLFGITLPENFRWPYLRRNTIEFWNAWHMSLSTWLRDYIFMPIGQRLFRLRALAASPLMIAAIGYLITMAFCGYWHGGEAHYLAWGLYQGIGLAVCKIVHSVVRKNFPTLNEIWSGSRTGAALSTLATFHFVAAGWLLFAYHIDTASHLFKKMVTSLL